MTLAEAFNASEGRPIQHDGRALHLSYWLSVAEGDRLVFRFLRSVRRPVQGIGFTAEKCMARVASAESKKMALWTDTAPEQVELEITKARSGSRLGIMNQWRDEKYGTTMMGVNNAAMEVLPQTDGSILFRCSDGWEGPDFNDLVFQVTPRRTAR